MAKKKKASVKKPKAKAKSKAKKTTSHQKSVHPELYFMVVDGSAIKSIRELVDTLDRMSDDTFYYHVNEMKNDFATWVKDVFKEMELAEKLLESETKDKHLIEVLKFLVKGK